MLPKLLAIARKDVYVVFKDRNALIYMFAMPIAVSVIIGLAFGSSGDVSISPVPVAVIDQDTGTTTPDGSAVNLGKIFEQAFVPAADTASDSEFAQIHDLTDGELMDDPAQARAQVKDGDLAAAITITGADFSANALTGNEPSTVDIFYDSGRSVGPSVIRSIVNGITNDMNTVILAERLAPSVMAELGQAQDANQAVIGLAVGQMIAEAMDQARSSEPIQLEQQNLQGRAQGFDALQYFAPSMAILFMTFAMATGGTTILRESRAWTLQRVMTTPTPRWVFMGGKLTGIYATGVIQMVLLILSTSLIARLMGRQEAVWGTNYVGIVLMILTVVFTATSLGLLIAAVAQTPEQAQTYNTVVIFLLGMLGGSFIPIEGLPAALKILPRFTLNYWGIDGFFRLAFDNVPIRDISTNMLVLVVMGIVLFAVSLWRFRRRLDF
jgi:ABC-2 type transport system permease protein